VARNGSPGTMGTNDGGGRRGGVSVCRLRPVGLSAALRSAAELCRLLLLLLFISGGVGACGLNGTLPAAPHPLRSVHAQEVLAQYTH
jgi:hypothetical protein